MSLAVANSGPVCAFEAAREATAQRRYPPSSAKLSASEPPPRAKCLGPSLRSRFGPNLGTPLKPSSSEPLRARPRSAVIVRAATDLYQTLGVPYNANKQEIKKAFREMARKYHPDVSQASGSARAFQAIVAAYEVLSDDQQRRLYDLSVQRAATSVRTAASRAAAGRGATVARGASVRVAGAPNRSSPRHWSSVSSATSAHGSSASLDPFDRAFSASVRPSVEPGPGSAQASTSECPIFSAWYLRWLFHARWALAVQQRARRVAAFKTRSSGGMSPSYAATGMSRGAWRGEHEAHEEEQGHGGGERKWRHAQRDKLDWRTGDGAGQEAGRSRWRGAEQAGSDGLLEQGGLLEGDECSSGRGGVAAAAASGGGGVAAAAGGGSGGVEQGATLAGEKPEWRASFGSDLVFILVSIILGVLYGTNATLAWLSLVLILSANTRLGLKVAGAVAWRLGGMPGLGIGVGLHALSFLLGNVHHEAVGAMALVVWMGRRGMGGGGVAMAPTIVPQASGLTSFSRCTRLNSSSLFSRSFLSPSPVCVTSRVQNERRERLVKASRDVTIQSKKIIFAIHRATSPRALAAAAQQLASLRAHHIAQVARELRAEDYWRFTRAYTWGLQEYVEAASFLHFRQTGRLLTLAQVNGAFEGILDREGQAFHVHAADYVLGLADLTGEVMRLAVSSRAAAAADGGGGAAAGNAGGGDGGAGSTGKGTSRRGKRQREQPEAQAKASGAEPAAASEPVAAAEPEAEAGEGRGELVVDADACRLFVQRLYAGFSLLPRSSELGKEMGKKMDVMLASLNKIENGFSLLPRSSEVGKEMGKKMDVMLASLNKIENEYPEDLLQLGLEGREAGGVEGE
ncbi:unnamed protein product [Closterium sp. NIES-65]|nr:unnamed protein product [Closterium sp. NIES-65]